MIKISGPTNSKADADLKIKGKFSVSKTESALLAKGAEIPKHIVLVVTRGVNYQSCAPFENVIVFPDDVKEVDSAWQGHFNFSVFDCIGFQGAGEYFILCSLGKEVSNVLKVIVGS